MKGTNTGTVEGGLELELPRRGERLLYTIDETCALLGGLARSYVWKLLGQGVIRSVKVGRRRMIARQDLEAYVERLREEGA